MTQLQNHHRTRPHLLAACALGAALLLGCHKLLGLTGAPPPDPQSASSRQEAPADAGSGGPGDAASPPGGSPACTEYCESVSRACTGPALQYQTDDDCSNFCAELEKLDPFKPDCRTSRLQDFGPDVCSAAGPTGSMIEGPSCEDRPCELYCGLMRVACGDTRLGEANSDAPTAADQLACLQICNALDPSQDFDVAPPPVGGNLNCRIHHINLALRSPAGSNLRKDHCLHAAGQEGLFEARFTPCPD